MILDYYKNYKTYVDAVPGLEEGMKFVETLLDIRNSWMYSLYSPDRRSLSGKRLPSLRSVKSMMRRRISVFTMAEARDIWQLRACSTFCFLRMHTAAEARSTGQAMLTERLF